MLYFGWSVGVVVVVSLLLVGVGRKVVVFVTGSCKQVWRVSHRYLKQCTIQEARAPDMLVSRKPRN